jgi:hypothetical protein
VRAMSLKLLQIASIACLAVVTAGCGDLVGQDRSSVILVIDALEAASGADTSLEFTPTLNSDVLTQGGFFSDPGRVTIRVISKDLGEALTATNAVTINRYLVTFRRTDGRNMPGRDVPQPFDSALTFTVASGTAQTRSFELIRHVAKFESPLIALRDNAGNINFNVISTIADITFFGRDQAGREVSVTGSIGIQFGDFADPT